MHTTIKESAYSKGTPEEVTAAVSEIKAKVAAGKTAGIVSKFAYIVRLASIIIL